MPLGTEVGLGLGDIVLDRMFSRFGRRTDRERERERERERQR